MKVSRGTILEMLNERGEGQKIDEAERLLPEEVDTDRDAEALSAIGLDAQAITGYLDDRGGEGDRPVLTDQA